MFCSSQFSVCGFKAEVDGRVLVGKVKEKEHAKEVYSDAIAQGNSAAS